jgi:beta-carotene 3-hydroxylase
VHQRWPFKYVPRKGYLKRVYQAHRMHHAVKGRDGCVSFGFVYAESAVVLRKKLQDNSRRFPTSAEEDQNQSPSGH